MLAELARLGSMRDVAAHWHHDFRGVPLELVLDRLTSASASRGQQAP